VSTGQQVLPAGYHVERRTNPLQAANGAFLFGGFYGTGIGVAVVNDLRYHTGWLALPVVGPWVVLLSGATACDAADETAGFDCHAKEKQVLLVIDSLAQAGGIVWFIAGMRGSRVVVRDRVASVIVVPSPLGVVGYGALLAARF
jgi:hypothetical protein